MATQILNTTNAANWRDVYAHAVASIDQAAETVNFTNSDGTITQVYVTGLVVTGGVPTGGTVSGMVRLSAPNGAMIESVDDIPAVSLSKFMTMTNFSLFSAIFIGDDVQIGNNGNDRLEGRHGNDILSGGNGDDTLMGGNGNDKLIGGNGNDILQGDSGNNTLQGGEGSDMISFATATSAVIFTLGANGSGTYTNVFGGVDIYSSIENIMGGAGNDSLTGDGADNILIGLLGNNTLDGAGGNDIVSYAQATVGVTANLATGSATDTFISIEGIIGSGFADSLSGSGFFEGGAGNDTITATGNSTMSFNSNNGNHGVLVMLDSLGAGIASDEFGGADTYSGIVNIRGSKGNDFIAGNGENNRIEGMAGNDTLSGGAGVDTVSYSSGMQGVYVNLEAGLAIDDFGDIDEVSGFENVDGSLKNDIIIGNLENNLLNGFGGNDLLFGGQGIDTLIGGAGNDTMTGESMEGGAGDDSYTILNASDVIVELANNGYDAVSSAMDYVLGDYLEQLTLTGMAHNATGNAENNYIFGNDLDNIIDGMTGADTMNGGGGGDTYFVDNIGDRIIDGGQTGVDLVNSSVSFTLDGSLENLTLTGSNAINGTGNNNANILTGNSAINTLTGLGGDDIYNVGLGDIIVEGTAGGTDRVNASSSYTLQKNVENLYLMEGGNYNATGNSQSNFLVGNAGNNSISGGAGDDALYGGFGLDTLTGGAGNDRFYFNKAISAGNIDTITDFTSGADKIMLQKSVFGALDLGAVSAFEKILYDQATGTLTYDADGAGAGVGKIFAYVNPGTVVTASDFLVV
jgi:Ca2+-binding RTX toxin-like protein